MLAQMFIFTTRCLGDSRNVIPLDPTPSRDDLESEIGQEQTCFLLISAAASSEPLLPKKVKSSPKEETVSDREGAVSSQQNVSKKKEILGRILGRFLFQVEDGQQ
ncbi:hypothetical protein P7K49_000284 [Saguinus oedipus]|uniref:Uncharacterized protein n=1 Tax=Saguinus oedipus TaxID=9490 RepID=A0ABQ9WDR3_SAGOE|nr:hypothetical protein P7K49_000284 [Saguinus oedipus]